jgi:hypothetical protein
VRVGSSSPCLAFTLHRTILEQQQKIYCESLKFTVTASSQVQAFCPLQKVLRDLVVPNLFHPRTTKPTADRVTFSGGIVARSRRATGALSTNYSTGIHSSGLVCYRGVYSSTGAFHCVLFDWLDPRLMNGCCCCCWCCCCGCGCDCCRCCCACLFFYRDCARSSRCGVA